MKTFIILSLLILNACAQVTIKDMEFYDDEGSLGAYGVHTLTTVTEQISQPEWDTMRFGMLCTSASNFAYIKATIESLCSASKDCNYAATQTTLNMMQTLLNRDSVKQAILKDSVINPPTVLP